MYRRKRLFLGKILGAVLKFACASAFSLKQATDVVKISVWRGLIWQFFTEAWARQIKSRWKRWTSKLGGGIALGEKGVVSQLRSKLE